MSKETKSLLFTTFLFIMFCLMAWEARSFADMAKFFPFFVAIGAAFIAFVSMILQTFELMKNKRTKEDREKEEDGEGKKMFIYIFWVVSFILLIYVIGFIPATIVFLLMFLLFESKFRVLTTFLSTMLVIGALLFFANIMNLYWPTGLFDITIFG